MDINYLAATALGVVALMAGTWLVSLVLRNASIVDLIWGAGFVLIAWITWFVTETTGTRSNILLALTTLWGLRLTGYLSWRNIGHGEDYRYVRMRRRWGSRFPLVSLGTVFTLQGVLMWIVSLPVQVGMTAGEVGIGLIGLVGVALWAIGMFFETVGDLQLARFKADPANAGKVMDQGLWSWTRHPNYFGDFCVWWGLGLLCLETAFPEGLSSPSSLRWSGVLAMIGPVVMTVLLTRVSGKALLERGLKKRREGYDDYVARTSGFFPRPPRTSTPLVTSDPA